MKLRTQILWLGIAGACVSTLVGAAGLMSVHDVVRAFDGAIYMGEAAQNSQSASMMNGAIRADVQKAMLGAIGRDKKQIADARKDLGQHVKSLKDALDGLKDSPLSAEAKAEIGKTIPLADAFMASAEKIVQLAASDTAAAAVVPEFQKLAASLEAQMALQVAAIQADQKRFSEDSRSILSNANYLVVGALLAASAGLVVGALAVARRISSPMTHAAKVSRRLATGDLTVEVLPSGNDETVTMLGALSEMRDNLSRMVAGIKSNASQVAAASAEIAQGNHDLSARTERQAGSLAATASSMKRLAQFVESNAASAAQATHLAIAASKVAAAGGPAAQGVADTMKAIDTGSTQISNIIGVIDGIAFQTNVLALNASVEAARAGDLGRGFSVVAAEVRSLATRAADAAKEIKKLIDESAQQVGLGSQLVGRAGDTMTEVVASVDGVTELMGRINEATNDQSAAVSKIGATVEEIDDVTQQNATLVEQMAAAASSLSGQANALVATVSEFRLAEGAT